MSMFMGDDKDANFLVGDEQVDRLYLGRALVWPQSAIVDFEASDNLLGEIKITWTDTNDPLPTSYDLYEENNRVQTDVTSEDVFDALPGTSNFFVRGLFDGGHSLDSNIDSGTSLDNQIPSDIVNFTASDNLENAVSCTWSAATGDPTPTYDIYRDGGKVGESATAGWIDNRMPGTSMYHVAAKNIAGETVSNSNSGTAIEGEEPDEFPPSPALNFNATDSRTDGIMCTWLEPQEGTMPFTHELHATSGYVFGPITSGFLWDGSHGEIAPTTDLVYGLFVKTINSYGYSTSAYDAGMKESIYIPPPPSGEQVFTSNGTFTVPTGLTSINLCMVGGGGSGGAGWGSSTVHINAGGGHSGNTVSVSIAVTPGETISVVVGSSGQPVSASTVGQAVNGNSGTSSSFRGYTAGGGGGGGYTGSGQAPYNGDGGTQTGCNGTFRDGYAAGVTNENSAGGGQGNTFGNGGNAGYNSNGQQGGYGTGGGGGVGKDMNAWSGAGNGGAVRVYW